MMKGTVKGLVVVAMLAVLWWPAAVLPADAPADVEQPVFNVITIDAAITPAVADYIIKSIDEVRLSGAAGLVIQLDTPGGLDTAMRDIVKAVLNSPIPVVVYVAPPGARAASAGVMITMA
ncbi:MAG TPA: nodulation protein NfeD, partial [Deltaproteobacteria bacterium]|nr:nodulation protein NfeD [Deltaproteobacteria bacterium]